GTAADAQTAIDNCESAVNTAVGNAGDPRTASKCDSKIVAAMGKKLGGLLSCDSKESSKGLDQSACRSGVSGKFSAAIGKLSAATDCTNGAPSAASLEPVIDTCRTNINAAIPAGGGGGGCQPLVTGQPISGTYTASAVAGPKICTQNATSNAFKICSADTDCG